MLTCCSIAAQRLCEALAFRIDQRRGAGRRNRIDALRYTHAAFEHRRDHARLDGRVVGRAALPGVAIALDQARTLGDLQREAGRELRGRNDAPEPGLDRALLLGEAPAVR